MRVVKVPGTGSLIEVRRVLCRGEGQLVRDPHEVWVLTRVWRGWRVQWVCVRPTR